MTALKEYQFTLHGTSPDVLSAARSIEYLTEIVKIFGNRDAVRLRPISKGSFVFPFGVFEESVPSVNFTVRDCIASLRRSDSKLSRMLADDKFTADLMFPSGEKVEIPVGPAEVEPIRRVSEPLTIQGRLTRVEGSGEWVMLGVDTDGGIPFQGVRIRAAQARELAGHFHAFVRLVGEGSLSRDALGHWRILAMNVHSFSILPEETLEEVLQRLEGILEPGKGAEVLSAVEALGDA